MIVDKNGIINIENMGIIISPETTVQEFDNKRITRPIGSGRGYDTFIMPGMIIDNMPFAGFFLFYNGKIAMITIRYCAIKGRPQWESEASDKKIHDKLMIQQHGAIKVTYNWGIIGSSTDAKQGGAEIVIKYNNFPIKERE